MSGWHLVAGFCRIVAVNQDGIGSLLSGPVIAPGLPLCPPGVPSPVGTRAAIL
jgi:hypothetical protein